MNPYKLDILFEDEHLVAVNKPAGIPVIPERFETGMSNLLELMRSRYPDVLVIHRIDRDTSGVVLMAKDAETHREMNGLFQDHRVHKVYLALVTGAPLWDEQTVDLPLRTNGDRRHRTVVDPARGKPSTTHYRVIERLGPYSLVEAIPKSGRTHQIRVHLAAVGAPIAVDALYGADAPVLLSSFKRNYTAGAREEKPLLGRLGLHARRITFPYAKSGADLAIEAPLPKDFRATLNQLRKYGVPGGR